MTPDEVAGVILDEIATGRTVSDAHGVDLRRCLVTPPRKRVYLDSFDEDAPTELWLVLEENPDDHSGYEIVYDDIRNTFGLAITTKDAPVFIGYYGTFLNTLEAM